MDINTFGRDPKIKAIGIILGSVIIFNSLPRFGIISQYLDKYPLIMLAIGVGIIAYFSTR